MTGAVYGSITMSLTPVPQVSKMKDFIVAAAAVISLVLYAAYYRMEEMKAFYAAMIPLITEAAAMIILTATAAMNS